VILKAIIIYGDPKKTDNRGKEIKKILYDENLTLLNNQEPTRINPSNGKFSNIDLTFANTNLSQRLERKVLPNITSSDYFPIIIQITPRYNDTNHSTERWNLKKPNWTLFSESWEMEISKIKNIETLNINQLTEVLTKHIVKIGELTIGKTKTKNLKPRVPWWNLDIKKAIIEKKEALKNYKKTKNPKDFINLKKLKAKSKYLIKTSKKLSWEKFTSSINDKVDSKLIWNKIKSLKGLSRNNKINLYDKNTNELINNPEQIPNELEEYFYKNSSNQNYTPQFSTFKQQCEKETIINTADENHIEQIQMNHSITPQEISHFITKSKSKSLGPDQIPYEFIYNFGRRTLEVLTSLYNKILREGVWPETWKCRIVIPIPKPEKNKFNTEGYRPITLLNTMCKLLEKIINFRLNWLLEKKPFLFFISKRIQKTPQHN
jgi:hypothetical protein